VVTVREREPVARMMVQSGGEPPRLWLVAGDGVVFEGAGYPTAVLKRLLWLDGVRLRRSADHGFEPIGEMCRTAELLRTAQALVPELFEGWQVVSLAAFASDHEIKVRSAQIPEIVFDVGREFPQQLGRLDYIVDFLRTKGGLPMQRIDLSLGGQVPVELGEAVPLKSARISLPKTASQTKPRRDF